MPPAQREFLFPPPSLGDCIFPWEQASPATTFLSDAFLAETWQTAPSEWRCPRILSLWLPWLNKADKSNASAQGLSASLTFFFPFSFSHRGSKGISKEWQLIAYSLIQSDWLLGALKNLYHSHGDRSRDITCPQSPTSGAFPEMSVLTTSENQERKCRNS